MEGHIYKLQWAIDGFQIFGYQTTDHLLWAYHFPFFSVAWRRECRCH